MSDNTQEEAHTGPIKTPSQLLAAVFFAFAIPVAIIMGFVAYVSSDSKPAGSTSAESYSLGGLSADDIERGVAQRIRKVGAVEIRDANRALKTGEEIFKAQCSACHATGAAGAPKFGDASAWGPRIKNGYEALLTSALKGKGAMGAQGGGDFEDVEIGRAVVYMANAGGAKFPVPDRPAAAGAAAAPAEAAPAAAAAPAAPAAPAAMPVAAAAPAAAANNGEATYKATCVACHGAGVAGAPKFGDKAAWAPRIKQGTAVLYASALKGKGAMPPKGGSGAPDADIKAAVDYMVGAAK